MASLLNISNHNEVLKSLIDKYEDFELTKATIISIHKDLMGLELCWNAYFRSHLVGEYGNIPTIESRQPPF